MHGLERRVLGPTQGSDSASFSEFTGIQSYPTTYFNSDVYIRHSDGSEDLLASGIAQTTRDAPSSSGYQNATWVCPETVLASGDAIRVWNWIKIHIEEGAYSWITEPLMHGTLESSTWTFRRYTASTYTSTPPFYFSTGMLR